MARPHCNMFLFMGYACPICILPCSFSISLSFTAFQAGSMEPPCQCHQTDRCQCFCSLMGSALTSCHQQSYSTVRPTYPAPPSLHAVVLQTQNLLGCLHSSLILKSFCRTSTLNWPRFETRSILNYKDQRQQYELCNTVHCTQLYFGKSKQAALD